MLNRAISHSREELEKLDKAVKKLEDKVELQEHLTMTNNFYTEKSESESSFDGIGSLDNLQKTIYKLFNDVQNQENQIRSSLNDIRQTINDFELSKTFNVKQIQETTGPSLRGNFNTASLPYRWWNRSMPCLQLLERPIYVSGSQDSLTESFQIRYFTPTKKKPESKMPTNQNSGYCVWLQNNKTGEVCWFYV